MTATSTLLKNLNMSKEKKHQFIKECVMFLVTLVTKLQENSPLTFQLVRCSSCISPKNMLHDPEASLLKFENIVDKSFSNKRMSFSEADRAKQQYESFLGGTVPKIREKFEGFNSDNSRIDMFWAGFLARNEEFKWFWFVCKIISTLSHGQSQVERGFNVNKEILVENLQEESLKGQRIINDHIQSENIKLQDFKLTNELFSSCKAAHQIYTIALEENKLSVIENEKKVKRELIDHETNDVKKRKLDLETCVERLNKDADKLSFEAEQKNNLTLLIKANSFRKTATEKTIN